MTRQLTSGETRLYFGLYVTLTWGLVVAVGLNAASMRTTERREHPRGLSPHQTPTPVPLPALSRSSPGNLTNREISDVGAHLCGVDPDFAWALAMRESSGQHHDSKGRVLRSHAGAYGLFQVKLGTARDLGLDARDRFQNALAGLCYYRGLLDRFGDPHRALVAYHRGANGGTSKVSRDYATDIVEAAN